jgi:hypothetical protein
MRVRVPRRIEGLTAALLLTGACTSGVVTAASSSSGASSSAAGTGSGSSGVTTSGSTSVATSAAASTSSSGSTSGSTSTSGGSTGRSSTGASSSSSGSSGSSSSSSSGATDGGLADAGPTDAGSAPAFGLGDYEGASCTCNSPNAPAVIEAFAAWADASVPFANDYAPTSHVSWSGWAAPGWQTPGWTQWKQADPRRRLVYAPGLGIEGDAGQDIDAGAAGDFNADWELLGQNLVSAGLGDSIIRIAHEFNGNWYWYNPAGQEAQFIAYWQQIVTAMRAVPGSSFQFAWNPSIGVASYVNGSPYYPEGAYPGDAYVDYIGPDTYDSNWSIYPTSATITAAMQQQVWTGLATGDHGLAWYVTFAAQHGKPLAIPEWGLWAVGSGHGGGDDPAFIQNMHDWFFANPVAFGEYFDYGDNQIDPASANGFTSSAALFQTLGW